jgi:nitric oxide reductase subunit B
MIAGFAVLSYLTVRTYTDAPPTPGRVEDTSGRTLFTSDDILRGQEVFLKYGLMEHGTLWGHGGVPRSGLQRRNGPRGGRGRT